MIPLADVTLNPLTQKFSYAGLDVTDRLTPSQKRGFPGYDLEAENLRHYRNRNEAYGRQDTPGGSTSVAANFLRGVGQDVSNGTAAVRDFFTGESSAGPGGFTGLLKTLAWLAALAALAYIAYVALQLKKTAT